MTNNLYEVFDIFIKKCENLIGDEKNIYNKFKKNILNENALFLFSTVNQQNINTLFFSYINYLNIINSYCPKNCYILLTFFNFSLKLSLNNLHDNYFCLLLLIYISIANCISIFPLFSDNYNFNDFKYNNVNFLVDILNSWNSNLLNQKYNINQVNMVDVKMNNVNNFYGQYSKNMINKKQILRPIIILDLESIQIEDLIIDEEIDKIIDMLNIDK